MVSAEKLDQLKKQFPCFGTKSYSRFEKCGTKPQFRDSGKFIKGGCGLLMNECAQVHFRQIEIERAKDERDRFRVQEPIQRF